MNRRDAMNSRGTKVHAHCPNGMEHDSPEMPAPSKLNSDQEPAEKEVLLGQLADKLVQMGWLSSGSPGVRAIMDNFRQAPEDQILGLIEACERRIADPPRCGCAPRST